MNGNRKRAGQGGHTARRGPSEGCDRPLGAETRAGSEEGPSPGSRLCEQHRDGEKHRHQVTGGWMSYTSSGPASRKGVKRGQKPSLSAEFCRQWHGPQPASSPSALGRLRRGAPTAQGPISRGSARCTAPREGPGASSPCPFKALQSPAAQLPL